MTMSLIEMEKALKQLRLSGIRATLETRVVESQAANLSFLETFSALLHDELDTRRSRLLERHFKLSGLDERVSLEEFDWGYNPKIPKRACFDLHTLKFVREGENPILIGPPGTGKSHVAKAIAYAAVRAGYRVLYAEADTLLGELVASEGPVRHRLWQAACDADLLILDDLFLTRQMGADNADQLQALVHRRYKRRLSTFITSNRVITDWERYLGDAPLTTAILDRLMHRGAFLEFAGHSYRLKDAARRLAKSIAGA